MMIDWEHFVKEIYVYHNKEVIDINIFDINRNELNLRFTEEEGKNLYNKLSQIYNKQTEQWGFRNEKNNNKKNITQ